MTCLVLIHLLSLMVLSHGWHLVMKVPRGADLGESKGIYDLWISNHTLNENENNVANINPGIPYKSADILHWERKSISLLSGSPSELILLSWGSKTSTIYPLTIVYTSVKLSFYKLGEEVAFIVFGAAGSEYNHSGWPVFYKTSNRTSWFDCARIMYSTWGNLLAANIPDACYIHSDVPVNHSFSILNTLMQSESDCGNITGWFMVLEPSIESTNNKCALNPVDTTPQFLYTNNDSSVNILDALKADVLAIFVDDCIDKTVCHNKDCWQDPLGRCTCYGYQCLELCSHLPCANGQVCVPDLVNNSAYTCQCRYGYDGEKCRVSPVPVIADLIGGAIAGIVIAVVACLVLVTIMICYIKKWRHRKDHLKQEIMQRAVLAKDFVRRSVNRLSGRQHQYPRKPLKEENSNPTINTRGISERLSADSSVVFGETNLAFTSDEPSTPIPTPPVDRRYTDFPTRQDQMHATPTILSPDIILQEKNAADIKQENAADIKQDIPFDGQKPLDKTFHSADTQSSGVTPHSLDISDRASTIGSFEKASAMSEMSDVTSTSGFSDYTGDSPANLLPSEMISKDILPRHGKHRHKMRSRPSLRASTAEPSRTHAAPETAEIQINYARERSRRSISSVSSLSSEATHKSDSMQRSGEMTKSEVLRARYENVIGQYYGDPAGRMPRFDHVIKGEGPSYTDIKRQLDADMSRREAREHKLQLELEQEAKYEKGKTRNHKIRQVESLDSGIDAEQTSVDHNIDGKLKIVRARSADPLDRNIIISFSLKEATV